MNYIGYGGSCSRVYPFNLVFNSFREWDHFNEPTGNRPPHRFWTWAKLDRPVGTPVGDCKVGNWANPTQTTIDEIFACDVVVMDTIVPSYLGNLHGVGNEPNWFPAISSENYAYQYGKYVTYIQALDANAQFTNGGIPQMVAGWETWVDDFLTEYNSLYGENPPIDIWTLHPYANDWPDAVAAANTGVGYVQAFRTWMDANGYLGVPIQFGEFSDATGGNSVANLVLHAKTWGNWLKANAVTYNITNIYWWGCTTAAMANAGLYTGGVINEVGDSYVAYCGRTWFVANSSYSRNGARLDGSYLNPFTDIPGSEVQYGDIFINLDTEVVRTYTPGIRVDGLDSCTVDIAGILGATSGKVRFNWTPRHGDGVFESFGVENQRVVVIYKDANNRIILYCNTDDTILLLMNIGGAGSENISWDASGIAAGTTYLVEIEYNSTKCTVKFDGVPRHTITYTGGIDFGANIPDTVYIGLDSGGGNQGDAIFSAP